MHVFPTSADYCILQTDSFGLVNRHIFRPTDRNSDSLISATPNLGTSFPLFHELNTETDPRHRSRPPRSSGSPRDTPPRSRAPCPRCPCRRPPPGRGTACTWRVWSGGTQLDSVSCVYLVNTSRMTASLSPLRKPGGAPNPGNIVEWN